MIFSISRLLSYSFVQIHFTIFNSFYYFNNFENYLFIYKVILLLIYQKIEI
jgi:hypothetical protein